MRKLEEVYIDPNITKKDEEDSCIFIIIID